LYIRLSRRICRRTNTHTFVVSYFCGVGGLICGVYRWDNLIWKSAREAQRKQQENQGLVGERKPNVSQRKHIFNVAREALGLPESEEMEEVEVDKGERVSRT